MHSLSSCQKRCVLARLLPLPAAVAECLAEDAIAAEIHAAWSATVHWLRPTALRSRALSTVTLRGPTS